MRSGFDLSNRLSRGLVVVATTVCLLVLVVGVTSPGASAATAGGATGSATSRDASSSSRSTATTGGASAQPMAMTGGASAPRTSQSSASAGVPAAKSGWVKTAPRPSAQPAAAAPVQPKDVRQRRARSVRSVLSSAAVPDTCHGKIVTGVVYPCTTPSAGGVDSFSLTLTSSSDLLVVRVGDSNGNRLPVSVVKPDATVVDCQQMYWYEVPRCSTSGPGTYTVQVSTQGSPSYTLSVLALMSDESCSVANPSFATGTLRGSLAAGAVGVCYSLGMLTGSVLNVDMASVNGSGLSESIFDARGEQVCSLARGDCTLTGSGPYRALLMNNYGTADDYAVIMNNLTHPTGCLQGSQLTFGQAPDTSSTIRCRILHVTKAGTYRVYAVSPQETGLTSSLYFPDGSAACTNTGPMCSLAAGDYTLLANTYPLSVDHIGAVFMAADESRGCQSTGDTGFATGAVTGTFAGIGQILCLSLPTASGKSAYIFNEIAADGTNAVMSLVDSAAVPQCPDASFSYAVCQLTGVAPFHMLLAAQTEPSSYRALVQRTDLSAGCPIWPQSGFGGSWGAEVSLTASSMVGCFSIPAGQHSTGEMIDYLNNTNVANGAIEIYDPKGAFVCIGTSSGMCSLTQGVDYTALVSTASAGDTYRIVRRDVSKSAVCPAAASLTVGGPSTLHVLTSALDTVCERVTADAADKFWFGVRVKAPHPAGAILVVTDAAGHVVCWENADGCRVTGSTDYQIVTGAEGYSGISIPAHVDTWRVATAAGWAPECAAHQLSATGFGPMNGRLTESMTAYCAVVTSQGSQAFGVHGYGTGVPWLSMANQASWAAFNQCNGTYAGSATDFRCQPTSGQNQQSVLLVTPNLTAAPFDYYFQGVCDFGCGSQAAATISSVSPARGPAGGANQVVIRGTHLTLATQVSLASGGSTLTSGMQNPVISVDAAGTQLTVMLGTATLAPGTYDLVLDSVGYDTGTPSTGYLPHAYQVTAAPAQLPARFAPVGPTRVLDTRAGVGASKAKVAAKGRAVLQVAGVAGVPTSGITAVVMTVTAVGPASSGSITVYPDGRSLPSTPNVNFAAGQTIANLVTVPVVNGKVDLYNGSAGTVDLIADLAGYYTTQTGKGSALTTVGPTRVLDTRAGVGAAKAKVAAKGRVALQVAGVAGVPSSGVTAVVMTVTAVGPASSGSITVYPDGRSLPSTSNVNFAAGRTVADLVTVPVVNGKVDLYNGSAGTVDLVADLAGYYSADGSVLRVVPSARAMDTRTGLGGAGGVVTAGTAAVFSIFDGPGVPVDSNVTAVVLNVTVTSPQAAGALTVLSDGQPLPGTSNLNFVAGQTVSSLVVVAPVIDGSIDFYNGSPGTVHVVADVEGYFTS